MRAVSFFAVLSASTVARAEPTNDPTIMAQVRRFLAYDFAKLPTEPTKTFSTWFSKVGRQVSIDVPTFYEGKNEALVVEPWPTDACALSRRCMVETAVPHAMLPSFGLEVGSMPKTGQQNLSGSQWQCGLKECWALIEDAKEGRSFTDSAIRMERAVLVGQEAVICSADWGKMPGRSYPPELKAWMKSVCERMVLSDKRR